MLGLNMAAVRACVCFCRTFTKINKCSASSPIVFGLKQFNSRTYSILSYKKVKPVLHSRHSIWSPRDFSNVTGVLCRPKDAKDVSSSEGNFKGDGQHDSSGNHDQESSKKDEEKRKADEFSKRMMKYSFASFGFIAACSACWLVYELGSPPRDNEGRIMEDEFSRLPTWQAYIKRTYKEMQYYDKMIKEPSRDKLLPDPLTEPYYQPPYTLVLEMDGILIHPDWTLETGWRFKKRPGVDFFLQQVGPPLYEIVIYTSEQGFTAFPILDALDPHGFIMYRLFRDATRYMEGTHVKDLSCLNRDLSKVIFIDWDEKAYKLNPENAFRMKEWKGNDEDRSLIDLAIFLRTIATSEVEDVRTVLQFYNQFDDPLEAFRENHRKLQAQTQQQKIMEESKEKKSLTSAFRGGIFSHR